MKKFILTSIAVFFINLPAFGADLQSTHSNRGNWNAINLINHTDQSVYYNFGFMDYRIKPGASETYHSKFGDAMTQFTVSLCEQWGTILVFDGNGGFIVAPSCTKIRKICNDNKVYNADHIKTIDINGVNACIITCLDGGTTSCVIS